jgi:hypothetical protein
MEIVLKRGRSKIYWTICPIPVRPFDYIVKAGQAARPQTIEPKIKTVREIEL